VAERTVVICGIGLVTPLGLTSVQTAAEIRAGSSRCQASAFQDQRLRDITLSLLPEDVLPPLAAAVDPRGRSAVELRLIRLAGSAWREAAAGQATLPAAWAWPENLGLRPPAWPAVQGGLQIQAEHRGSMVPGAWRGRAGGLQALAHVAAAIQAGELPAACVGGVDSWADPVRLARLEAAGRLTSAQVSDGLIPGEAAACILLAERSWAQNHGLPLHGTLSAWATGSEPGYQGADATNRGDGLSETLAKLPAGPLLVEVFATDTGERCWAREWGISALRQHARLAPDHGLHHPAEAVGDTGAAAGLLAVGLAVLGITRGYRRAPALVIASNDGPERAAVIIQGA
jgi:3-oxoacyl-[acyl-carrier-protein] synthase I